MEIKDLLFNELLWSKEKIEIINYETDEIIFNIDRFENLYLDDEWNNYKDWSIKWFESRYNKEANESYIRFYIN